MAEDVLPVAPPSAVVAPPPVPAPAPAPASASATTRRPVQKQTILDMEFDSDDEDGYGSEEESAEDARDAKLYGYLERMPRSSRLTQGLEQEVRIDLEELVEEIDNYEGYGPGEDGHFIKAYEQEFKDFFGPSEKAIYFQSPGFHTRSKVSLYQLCDKFNQEAKLQVINKTAIPPEAERLANLEKLAVKTSEDTLLRENALIRSARDIRASRRASAVAGGGTSTSFGGKSRTRRVTRNSVSRRSMISYKKKPTIKILNPLIEKLKDVSDITTIELPNKHIHILTAINSVIENTKAELNSSDHTLVRYFEFMKKTYLFYKRKNADAFHTFNNSIDIALMLYLLNDASTMFDDEHINDTLSFIDRLYLEYYSISKLEDDGVMRGGDAASDFSTVYTSFKPGFDDFNGALPGLSSIDDKDAFAPYIGLINSLHPQLMNEKGKPGNGSEFDKCLQAREYKSLLDKTVDSYAKFSSPSVTVDTRNFQTYKKTFLFNASSLIDHIKARYELIQKMREAAEMAEEAGEGGAMSTGEAKAAQMVSVTVANIGYNYILNSVYPTAIGNEAFDKEIAIIKKVVETSYVPSTIDNNIRDTFMTFARRVHGDQYLGTAVEMKKFIDDAAKNKFDIIALNNAATESLIQYLKLPKKTHLCTTAQLADAMGTHGSCVGKDMSKKQELEPMEFMLKDRSEDKYYIGRTILDKRSTNLKQTIIYTAKCNGFFLPEVQVSLDTGYGKASLTLSANTSFKSVITTILDIWNTISTGGAMPTEQLLWDALINEKLYQRLIASGSRKSVGDFFQEINQVAANSGYSNDISAKLATQLRVGANGDQPSGVRAGWIKLKATSESINQNSLAGYVGNTMYNKDNIASDLYPSFFIKSRGFNSSTKPGTGGASASKSKAGGGTRRGGSKKNKTRKRSKKRV
jgi:hypothetical protein